MIVKVQAPLFSTNPDGMYLVYDQGNNYVRQQSIPAAAKKAMRSQVKMFFKAVWNQSRDLWEIGEVTEWQTW